MSFGVYVHIPYCLQRCIYCDFATYQKEQILPPSEYIERVKKEIVIKAPEVGPRPLDTLYFGGGTPSLLEPELLIDVLRTLAAAGFPVKPGAEVTIEINPATLDEQKISTLLKAGFNRFSVGAQTFNEDLLKRAHRKHSSQDTRDTLSLLRALGANFSLDILFALPGQTMDVLKRDLDEALHFDPPHVSPYCLTVPEGHPFSFGRPAEGLQVEMFSVIEEALTSRGLNAYEISNFARPGVESRHNLIYWNDDEYWGVGLSSHSYLHRFSWGCRFWNPRSIDEYARDIDALSPGRWHLADLAEKDGERLAYHQALTDYFHVSLRRQAGLDAGAFEKKFKTSLESVAGGRLRKLMSRGLLAGTEGGRSFALSRDGKLLSNQVFEELTCLAVP